MERGIVVLKATGKIYKALETMPPQGNVKSFRRWINVRNRNKFQFKHIIYHPSHMKVSGKAAGFFSVHFDA